MNLNRSHKVFGSGSKLKRDDIDNYRSASDAEKNRIEQNSQNSSFESDAFEGWEQVGYDTKAMARLDKKFSPSNNSYLYILSTAVILLILAGGYYFVNIPEDTNLVASNDEQMITGLIEDQKVILDQSDVIIPEIIEKMQDAPVKEQIEVSVIKDDFKEKKKLPVEETPIEIESLPVIAIKIEEDNKAEIARDHSHAKEIYLYDLKLVDYSKYRSNPTVKTKQIVLTGTPANKENELSEDEDPMWKVVQIPYTEYLNKSMKIFGKGQNKRALTRFETITETYEMDVNANFYGGLCLFNLGEYEKGITFFNRCILGSYSNFDEEAQWMIGLCHEKLGQKSEAEKIFKSIIENNGYYKSQAQKKLM